MASLLGDRRGRSYLVAVVAVATIAAVLGGIGTAGASTVGSLSVSVQPPVAGATGARYSIAFTNTSALSVNDTISLTGPAGTVFPYSCSYQIIDTTPNPDVVLQGACATPGDDTNDIDLYVWTEIPAGHALQIVADDVGNAATSGSKTLTLATSTDTSPAVAGFTLSAPSAVTGVTTSVVPDVAGASGARWTVDFSAPHQLHGYYSTIRLDGPSGMVFPTGCSYKLLDTTPDPDVEVGSCPTSGGGTDEVAIQIYGDVPAGHALQLIADDVTNPPTAGTYPLEVSTSSDPIPVVTNVALQSGPTAVTSASVVVSPSGTGSVGARWTTTFTSTHQLNYYYSTITLRGPSGTTFPGSCLYQLYDTTPEPDVNLGSVCADSGAGTDEVVLRPYADVPAGHVVKVVANDVVNPTGVAGQRDVQVSTSSDRSPVTASFGLTAASSISGLGMTARPSVAGATGARHTVSFTNSAALNYYYSTITLTGPEGTVYPVNCSYQLIDTTPNPDVSISLCPQEGGGTNEVKLQVYADVPAGHALELIIDDVVNPSGAAGPRSVSVSTSSDVTPVSTTFGLLAGPTAVTGAGVAIDNTLPGATDATYTVGFTNTSALNYQYSTVTVTGPPGTVFPNHCGYRLIDTTPNPDQEYYTCPVAGGGTNEVTVYGYGDVPAGHALQLIAPNVTNASSSGSKTIGVRTSSDQALVTVPFTLGLGIATTTLPPATSGAAYSTTLAVTGGTGPFTWSKVSGTLPSGLSLDPSTGTISGTVGANAGGSYTNLVFRVTDASNATSDSIPLTLNVDAHPIFQTADEVVFVPGITNTFWVSASGVPAPALSVSGTLPSGVTFTDYGNGSGALEGTPEIGSSGTYPLVFTASNGVGPAVTQDFQLDIARAASTSWVTASANPTRVGQSVTFTATVSGAWVHPTGTVEFFDGATSIGTATLVNGQASIATSLLTVGSHNITVSYEGSASFLPSTSSVLSHTIVDRTDTTTGLTSSSNPSVSGETVALVATVTGSGAVPTGTVTFFDGASLIGSVGVDSAGNAVLYTSELAVGDHPITAVYGGDAVFLASSSGALTQTVQRAGTNIGLTSSLNPSSVGAQVTFTAVLTAAAPGSGTPTGSVEFRDGATVLGNGTLNGSGVATFATSDLAVGTHQITAAFAGNPSFAGATSVVLDQSVNTAPLVPTTAVAASEPNPSVFGQSVTLTATVSGNGGTPSGAVAFFDGDSHIGSGVLDESGVATLSTSSLGVGDRTITAVYGGDATFAPSTSSGVTHTVLPAATTTALASSLNPSSVGDVVTFSATVSVVAPGAGGLGGSVQFRNGANVIGSATVDSTGVATIQILSLPVGSHDITAAYSGNGVLAASTSSTLTQLVEDRPLLPTLTLLTSSLNPSGSGATVTFTATVAADETPGGSVQFLDGENLLGSSVLNGSGVATFDTSDLSVGTHEVTAVYLGNATFATSTSPVLDQVVTATPLTPTITSVTSSVNPSVVGQAVAFTATVVGASGTPTGTVVFRDGTTVLGSAALADDGTATFTTAGLAVGTHSITAAYQGDDEFAASTASAIEQAVNPAGTATELSSSANPSLEGDAVTFTATVTAAAPGAGTPGGDVEIRDGAAVLGTVELDESGTATFSTSDLAVGTHPITAVYVGSASFAASTSAAIDQVVESNPLLATSTSLTSSTNPSTVGQTVTFTATVAAGESTPTGTVQLLDGATSLGSKPLVGGTAAFDVTGLGVGDHQLTAVYSGDDTHATSTSSVLTQQVGAAATSIVLSSSANPSTVGQPITLTAQLDSAGGIPTGSVEFRDGTTVLGSAPISETGVAALEISFDAGEHPIVAVYAGNATFDGSTSNLLTQVVSAAPLGQTTTILGSQPNPSTTGQAVTFSAKVSGDGTIPTGTVEFREGTTVLGAGSVDATGIATFATAELTAGDHHITAAYSGDDRFAGSTSAEIVQVVVEPPVCDPLRTVTSVKGTARLANRATLTVDLNRRSFPFIGKIWVGKVTYRDSAARALVTSVVFTSNAVVTPMDDVCRGAIVRIDAVNLLRFPWRTGRLTMRIVDRTPVDADAVALTFPGLAPVSTTVAKGDLRVR